MPRDYDAGPVEAKWRSAWRQQNCFRAPDEPRGPKFYNFDSGPFPNGPLHLGHVRTYALGDMTARFQRLQGKCVLYATEFDAFGLPNETAARAAGLEPAEFTAQVIAAMTEDLQRLGVSYVWSRVHATCDPRYVRWTQWLFLELQRCGFVERKPVDVSWCPQCDVALGAMQVIEDTCWRCSGAVATRSSLQWVIESSSFVKSLDHRVDSLHNWSETGRRLLHRGLADHARNREAPSSGDWPVSRQTQWGTPVPMLHCARCGPVPASPLPAMGDGPKAAQFAACPTCGADAQFDSDRLDCFFDDSWSLFGSVVELDDENTFPAERLAAWLPVDCFHNGFDAFGYLTLYRFIGAFLHTRGLIPCEEPIVAYHGHDMVLAEGRKMSKQLGNVVRARDVINEHGADALRVGVLWAAGPERTMNWETARVRRARDFVERVLGLAEMSIAAVANAGLGGASPTRAMDRLASRVQVAWDRVARLIDDYRPHAALDELQTAVRLLADFVHARAAGRLQAYDASQFKRLVQQLAVVLSPLAPFAAEEVASIAGLTTLAAESEWPSAAAR